MRNRNSRARIDQTLCVLVRNINYHIGVEFYSIRDEELYERSNRLEVALASKYKELKNAVIN